MKLAKSSSPFFRRNFVNCCEAGKRLKSGISCGNNTKQSLPNKTPMARHKCFQVQTILACLFVNYRYTRIFPCLVISGLALSEVNDLRARRSRNEDHPSHREDSPTFFKSIFFYTIVTAIFNLQWILALYDNKTIVDTSVLLMFFSI